MTEGYINILFNPACREDQYKIGMTTRTPEGSALEVSSATGVPEKFEVLFSRRVADCHRAERLVHERLAGYHSGLDRGLFQVSLSIAIDVLIEVAVEVGLLPETLAVQEPSDRMADPVTTGDIDLFPRQPSVGSRRTRQSNPERPTCFEDHVAYTDGPRQLLLREVRNCIHAIDGRMRSGETVTPRQRIAYKIPAGTNFMEIKVQRSAILVRLPETGVVDPEGKVRKIPDTHGWGRLKDEIRILSASDVRTALPLIEAACRTELRNFE